MPGASCKAALFLKSFVDGIEPRTGDEEAPLRWAHIDNAGTMEVTESGLMELETFLMFPPQTTSSTPYLEKGMTGRPVR
jgi:aminopeptidase